MPTRADVVAAGGESCLWNLRQEQSGPMAALDLTNHEGMFYDEDDDKWQPSQEDRSVQNMFGTSSSEGGSEDVEVIEDYTALHLAQQARRKRQPNVSSSGIGQNDHDGAERAVELGSQGGHRLSAEGVHLYCNPAPGAGRRLPVCRPRTSSRLPRPSSPHDPSSEGVLPMSTATADCTPRKRRCLRKNGNWSNEQLKKALAAVDDGMSMKKASEVHHIPTLHFVIGAMGELDHETRVQKAS